MMASSTDGLQADPSSPAKAGCRFTDLLIPFDTARRAACDAARHGQWLDASLLAAGCGQVVEDHIHRSEGFLDRVSVHLAGDDPEPGRASRTIGDVAAVIRSTHRARPGISRLLERRDRLNELTIELSAAAAQPPEGGAEAELLAEVEGVLAPAEAWPRELAGRVLRLPSSFRSFDQQPADVHALAALVAERWPDRERPMLVVGIRTSGSYLAPIAAAALRDLGYRHVEMITVRADERLDRSQAAAAARARTGTALLIDDPPVSGSTVRDCIRPLVGSGIDADRIALMLALPDGWELAPFLDPHEQVILRGEQWRITALMEPEAIAETTRTLLARRGLELVGDLVATADPVGDAPGGSPRTPREHRRAAFIARIAPSDGSPRDRVLVAQGVGVGLFGHHDEAVAAELGSLVPDVLGVVDGVMYQLLDRPSGATSLSPHDAASYVHERHLRLPAERDHAAEMRGRKAAWEIAGMLVGGALGRADAALRVALIHPIVHQILQVERPSIIDARMTTDRFLPTEAGDRWVKADFADGAFSNRDLWCYDPIADLAAIGDEMGRPAEVRTAWERAGGHRVEPSRWMLLRLVAAWDRHRHGGLPQPEYGRTISGILADHIGELYLSDLGAADGPWCVTDVDGVLETSVLSGGTAPGRLGGASLRALVAHGYRVVPATGRSVPEVRQRCGAWGLPVGIAEYGAALLIDGDVIDLRDARQREAVGAVRDWLTGRDGVVIDEAYERSVRAWRTIDGRGRHPLSDEMVAELTTAFEGSITVVPGEDQTDLVATGVSKDRAVAAMLERLDPDVLEAARPLALAVGDGPADIGLLALGKLSVAPAHAADEVVRAAGHRVKGSYQQGFADAVQELIGHRPGSCPTCAGHLDDPSDALIEALSVHEAGRSAMPARIGRLAARARRAARSAPRSPA
ncbi:MAG: hypothetical protein JWO77_170 [Ilumatobacteraceae bacterium]|nr:hypothetical protein [Ilumatobacteraceae bacterium]